MTCVHSVPNAIGDFDLKMRLSFYYSTLFFLCAFGCLFYLLLMDSYLGYKQTGTTEEPLPQYRYRKAQPSGIRTTQTDLISTSMTTLSRIETTTSKPATTWMTVKFGYGLGNQLFMFAALLGLSDQLQCKPVLTSDTKLKRVFAIPKEKNFVLQNDHHFNSGCCAFKRLPAPDQRFNWTVSGFFQSWKYFANVSKIVRKSLPFRYHVFSSAQRFLRQWKVKQSTLIGIHVRRGDFLRPDYQAGGRSVASSNYIKRAQKFFRERFNKTQFLVITDDKEWCDKHITGSDVIRSSFTDPGVDLAMMSLCDHMIITVGTFGWWGAWFADGITVYYKNYPRPGSKLDNMTVREDYYPPDWVGL